MLIRRNKPCTSTGNSERNRYLKRKQRTGNRSFRIGKRNNQWNNHRHQMVSSHLQNISPTNKTIIVSFIGMETQEVTIKPEMKIVMTSTTEVMEEVFGSCLWYCQKNQLFTGSAKMIHTEQITKRPVTNVIESLSGQVAGLQMTMTKWAAWRNSKHSDTWHQFNERKNRFPSSY